MRALVRMLAAMAVLLAAGAASAQSTLRVVMLSDLKILDPIWTTAYIVRDHGYMIYDTLLAMDAELKRQAADGRLLDGERRQADLHVRVARRAEVP
jgi:peptide/nickel transport system substrate-binding protein